MAIWPWLPCFALPVTTLLALLFNFGLFLLFWLSLIRILGPNLASLVRFAHVKSIAITHRFLHVLQPWPVSVFLVILANPRLDPQRTPFWPFGPLFGPQTPFLGPRPHFWGPNPIFDAPNPIFGVQTPFWGPQTPFLGFWPLRTPFWTQIWGLLGQFWGFWLQTLSKRRLFEAPFWTRFGAPFWAS